MKWEETVVELKRNHIYADPLPGESGELVGLTVNANDTIKDDRIFYISNVLDKKEFKVFWDKKISKIVIIKK